MCALPEHERIGAIPTWLQPDGRLAENRARRCLFLALREGGDAVVEQHMEEDSVFGVPSLTTMRRKVELLPFAPFAALTALALLTTTGHAGPPNVKGKITGYDKLVPVVYAEAAKPEARRDKLKQLANTLCVNV